MAREIEYTFIAIRPSHRCYIYIGDQYQGRVEIRDGEVIAFPEDGVLYLPVEAALEELAKVERKR